MGLTAELVHPVAPYPVFLILTSGGIRAAGPFCSEVTFTEAHRESTTTACLVVSAGHKADTFVFVSLWHSG